MTLKADTLRRYPHLNGVAWSAMQPKFAMTRDARLIGAPPWRFWASGPRFRLLGRPPSYNGGQLPCGSVQRAPRSQVLVPGGRGPGPPGANGYKPPPRDATPRSAFRMSPETPLNERGWEAM